MWPSIDKEFEEGVQRYRRKSSRVDEFDTEEVAAILDLMRRMLAILIGRATNRRKSFKIAVDG